jgi:fused signal recognition particle receptor
MEPAATDLLEPAPAEAAAVGAVVETEAPAPPSLRDRMGKTRGLLSGYVRALRARGSVDDRAWEELEEALLRADIGVATTNALLEDLRERVLSRELRGPDEVLRALRDDLRTTLRSSGAATPKVDGDGVRPTRGANVGAPGGAGARANGTVGQASEPSEGDADARWSDRTTDVWLFVGVNGVGKTTTIGKVARLQVAKGHSVVLAAGDTFRAAAAEQLSTWAERTGVPVVRGAEGGDPSAVVYDAVRSAAARGDDLVLADTAGRLHTKVNLVEELKKIRRVADRPPGRVTEVLLVLDATTGQNGLAQARQFTEAVGVTGVVLTKLDGTAKGGIVVAIQRELGLPVKLVGIGEGTEDLVPFDADEFVEALFD